MLKLLALPFYIFILKYGFSVGNNNFLLQDLEWTNDMVAGNQITGTSLFGFSVAVAGDYIFISAPLANTGADDREYTSGMVYKCDFTYSQPPTNCEAITKLKSYTTEKPYHILIGYSVSTYLDGRIYICAPNAYIATDSGLETNCMFYDLVRDDLEPEDINDEYPQDIGLNVYHDVDSECIVVGGSKTHSNFKYKVSCSVDRRIITTIFENTRAVAIIPYNTGLIVFREVQSIYVAYVLPMNSKEVSIYIDRYDDMYLTSRLEHAETISIDSKYNISDSLGNQIIKYTPDRKEVILIMGAPLWNLAKGSVIVLKLKTRYISGYIFGRNQGDMFGYSICVLEDTNDQKLAVLAPHGGVGRAGTITIVVLDQNGGDRDNAITFELNQHIADLGDNRFVYKIHPDVYVKSISNGGITRSCGFLLAVNSNPGNLYRFTLHSISETVPTPTHPYILNINDLVDYQIDSEHLIFGIKPKLTVTIKNSLEVENFFKESRNKWSLELEPASLHEFIKFNDGELGRLFIEPMLYKNSADDDSIYEIISPLKIYMKKNFDVSTMDRFDIILKCGPLGYRSSAGYFINIQNNTVSERLNIELDIPLTSLATEVETIRPGKMNASLVEHYHYVDENSRTHLYESVNLVVDGNVKTFIDSRIILKLPLEKELLGCFSNVSGIYTDVKTEETESEKIVKINIGVLPYGGMKFSLRFAQEFKNSDSYLHASYEWKLKADLVDKNEAVFYTDTRQIVHIPGSVQYSIHGLTSKMFYTHPNTWSDEYFTNTILVRVDGWYHNFPITVKITRIDIKNADNIKILKIGCQVAEYFDRDDEKLECEDDDYCLNNFYSMECINNRTTHARNKYIAIHFKTKAYMSSDISIGFYVDLHRIPGVKINGDSFRVVSTISPLATKLEGWKIGLCVGLLIIFYSVIFVILYKTNVLKKLSIKLEKSTRKKDI